MNTAPRPANGLRLLDKSVRRYEEGLIHEPANFLNSRLCRAKYSRIDQAPGFTHGLEIDHLRLDLNHHEVIVLIVSHLPDRTFEVYVAAAGFTAGAGDEVLDALLRLGALV